MAEVGGRKRDKLPRGVFRKELLKLQRQLVIMQEFVRAEGLKVVARSGWFAARPSGTEPVYKIYAESFKDEAHLDAIVSEARDVVNSVCGQGDSAARATTAGR